MFEKIWNSDIVVLLRRMGIFYLVMALCRVVFYVFSRESVGAVGWDEVWSLAKGAFVFDSVSLVYANGLFVVLSLLPFRFRERKWWRGVLLWYFAVVNTAVIGLNMADIPYCHTTGIRITAADVMFAENDNTLQLLGQFAAENWYLVLIWTALAAGMVWLYRRSGKPVTPIRNRWAYFGANLAILAAALVLCLLMVRGGSLRRTTRPVTLSNAMAYARTPAKANMILSNPFCILRTAGGESVKVPEYFAPDELGTVFTPEHYPTDIVQVIDGDTLSAAALAARPVNGRNVVIFVLESFSAEHSALLNPHLYPDGVGYTPFLDSLMREGYYFTHAYAGGRKSIEALPSILASMPSFKQPLISMPAGLGEGMPLPKILASEGYGTMFFCGSPRGSMGFDAYARQAGMREIYDKDTYDQSRPGNADFDGWWGVWDEPFIDYMGEVLSSARQPFMSAVFTVTSHHPFLIPERYEGVFREGQTKVHRGIQYTDMALRRFFERYGSTEWARNTVFVFAADHVSSEKLAPETFTSAGAHHIISLIYTPDGSLRGRDDHVFQHTDIMPTVLGLVDYNKPYFAFGRDVFREPRREPMAVTYMGDFQIITDDLVLRFDERRATAAYSTFDTMQSENIASPDDPAQQNAERLLKAVIQQYYTRLKAMDYTVGEGEE